MYKIKAEGKEYYSDTLVYVKKAPKWVLCSLFARGSRIYCRKGARGYYL